MTKIVKKDTYSREHNSTYLFCFMKQNCHFQRSMAQCKHATTQYNFVLPQGAQKLPAKVQMKSLIYTILLSKSDFSFALLLVPFEPLEVQQSQIHLLKALKCVTNAVGTQGCNYMSTFCHAPLKITLLPHKMAKER